jgi:copper chaperone
MHRVWLDIRGMSCEHCVRAVSGALRDLPGVKRIEVSLEKCGALVESDTPVPQAHLRAAVEEAGYELTAVREEDGNA